MGLVRKYPLKFRIRSPSLATLLCNMDVVGVGMDVVDVGMDVVGVGMDVVDVGMDVVDVGMDVVDVGMDVVDVGWLRPFGHFTWSFYFFRVF
jgi:hypothetical protein